MKFRLFFVVPVLLASSLDVGADDQMRFFWGTNYRACRTNLVAAGFNTVIEKCPPPAACDYKTGKMAASAEKWAHEFFKPYAEDGMSVFLRPRISFDKALPKKYPAVRPDGEKVPGRVDWMHPEVKELVASGAVAYASFASAQPCCIGLEPSSETRDHSAPSLTPHLAAAYRAATGREIPRSVVERAPQAGRAAPHWSKLDDIPADRVIDENHPVLAFYRWFWKEGDGLNDLNTVIAKAAKSAFAAKGRRALSVFDPSQRTPPLWGSGGEVDFISHWTYPFPQPYNVSYVVAQQQEMAKGRPGQGVMTMIQAIMFRKRYAPGDKVVGDLPAWVADRPNARYVTTPPDVMREAIWSALSRRIDGIGFHGWNALYDAALSGESRMTSGYAYTNGETQRVVEEVLTTVAVPLGPMLRAMPERPPEVAVVESYASSILSGRAPWDWTMPQFHYGVVATAANLSPAALYEEDLAANGVPPSVKVLLMPNCSVLTRGAAEAVRAFRRRGGKIVASADLCPGVGAPDAELPFFDRKNRQTGDHDWEVLPDDGKGLSGRDDDRNVQETAARLRAAVGKFFAPRLSASGDHLLVHSRDAGAAAECLFAVNDKRGYGEYVGQWRRVMEKGQPNDGVVRIRRKALAVYDLVRHRRIGFSLSDDDTEIPVSFRTTDGRAFLVCDRPLGKLSLRVKRTRDSLTVTVLSPDKDVLVPVRLRCGDGKPVSGVVRDGRWSVVLPSVDGAVRVENLADGSIAGENLRPFEGLLPAPQEIVAASGCCRLGSADEIVYRHDSSLPEEGYRLRVAPDGVTVEYGGKGGKVYAFQTLKQLVGDTNRTATVLSCPVDVPCCRITDAPKYPWRGYMLDTSRHFFGTPVIKRTLDTMAYHKLNVFHWHLTDRQGWRLPVEGHPALTNECAVRKCGRRKATWGRDSVRGTYGPFFHSEADIREIIAYAAERGIDVVPEIDIPGHQGICRVYPFACCQSGLEPEGTNVWTKSLADLCVANPDVYAFYEKVFDEVCRIFPSKIIHIGGDEVGGKDWARCPKCRALMRERGLKDQRQLQNVIMRHFAEYLGKKGRRVIGWDEILQGGEMPPDTMMTQFHSLGKAHLPALAAGHEVVMMPGCYTYFDCEQGVPGDPYDIYQIFNVRADWKRFYSYDPRVGVPAADRKRVIGIQGCSWTELVCEEDELDWGVHPRLACIAEIGWADPPDRSTDRFEPRLRLHRERLVRMGINAAPVGPLAPEPPVLDPPPAYAKTRGFNILLVPELTEKEVVWEEDKSVPAGGYRLIIERGRRGKSGKVGVSFSDAEGRALGWRILRQLEERKNCGSVRLPRGEIRSY